MARSAESIAAVSPLVWERPLAKGSVAIATSRRRERLTVTLETNLTRDNAPARVVTSTMACAGGAAAVRLAA
jgi:hypothetical protein